VKWCEEDLKRKRKGRGEKKEEEDGIEREAYLNVLQRYLTLPCLA
jgi:hypothetical protein